jgi:ribosomal-protein-serine acetyltransferase
MLRHQLDGHLRLELPKPEQAEEVTKVVRENITHLSRWMPWALPDFSVEHACDWIERSTREAAMGNFACVILYDDKIIGTIGTHNFDVKDRHTSIGYWIDHRYEGKGIVSRCARVLIDYLFDKMELNRVQINCNVENTRSRAIPPRLGFTHEGVLRQVELLNGKFGDLAVYGLLKNEWHVKRI